jgi:hypothetical protein
MIYNYLTMNKTESERKAAMRQNIMLNMRANNLPVTGEFWLMLVFRTESELKKICQEMHIAV